MSRRPALLGLSRAGLSVATRTMRLDTGTHDVVVPVSGLLTLERTK